MAKKTGRKAAAEQAQIAPDTIRLRLKGSFRFDGKRYGPGEVDVPRELAEGLIANGASRVESDATVATEQGAEADAASESTSASAESTAASTESTGGDATSGDAAEARPAAKKAAKRAPKKK